MYLCVIILKVHLAAKLKSTRKYFNLILFIFIQATESYCIIQLCLSGGASLKSVPVLFWVTPIMRLEIITVFHVLKGYRRSDMILL